MSFLVWVCAAFGLFRTLVFDVSYYTATAVVEGCCRFAGGMVNHCIIGANEWHDGKGGSMAKIVAVDTDFEDNLLEEKMAHDAGVDFEATRGRDQASIIRNAADADGVVTSYAVFSREVFDALPQLKVVSRTGVGYDEIDVQAATDHGVAVCNVPGYGTEVVSDHAIALALAVLRRINEMDADMRAGIWSHARRRPLGQVHGRTFGVVGMGEIGRATARKAYGLGFNVICWSHSLKPGRRTPEGYPVLPLDELLRRSDVVSLHTALVPSTRHLIDERRLSLMKPGAVLVNTSRGAVVDTVALAQALQENRLWGAGIDVFEEEPVSMDHPIMHAPHTVLTPHAAYWSEESGHELRQRAMQAALDVVQGRIPVDCLNPHVFQGRTAK